MDPNWPIIERIELQMLERLVPQIRDYLERPIEFIGPAEAKTFGFAAARGKLVSGFEVVAADQRFQNDESYARMASGLVIGLSGCAPDQPEIALGQRFLLRIALECKTDAARESISELAGKLATQGS